MTGSGEEPTLVTTGTVSSIKLTVMSCRDNSLQIGIPSDFVVRESTASTFSAIPDKTGVRDIFPLAVSFYDRYPKEREPKPSEPGDVVRTTVIGEMKVTSHITGTSSAFVRVFTCIHAVSKGLWVVATLSTNFGDKSFSAGDLAAIIQSIQPSSKKSE
jgi:hypothetical protein